MNVIACGHAVLVGVDRLGIVAKGKVSLGADTPAIGGGIVADELQRLFGVLSQKSDLCLHPGKIGALVSDALEACQNAFGAVRFAKA